MTSVPGILCGLGAALFQSLSYLATRHFVQRRPPGASRMLLVLAHVWMGAFACVLLPLSWPQGNMDFRPILWPLAGTAVFYLLGQLGLMMALKNVEPSRVSPLLGFKIVFLAIMSVTLPPPNSAGSTGNTLTALQWAGTALCVVAAVSLNYSGKRLSAGAIFAILFACIAYSLSDWHITLLVVAIQQSAACSFPRAAMFGAALSYIVCGVIALPFLVRYGSRQWKEWRGAIPFALAWFAGMLTLYTSFGLLNVLFGNILQSTRGLMSVAISTLLVRWGHLHLEPETGKGVFIRRLAAATLMFLAVTLYMIGKPPKATIDAGAGNPAGTVPASR
jgi:hypothetical protein